MQEQTCLCARFRPVIPSSAPPVTEFPETRRAIWVASSCCIPPTFVLTSLLLTRSPVHAHVHTHARVRSDEGPERILHNDDPRYFMANDRIHSIQHVDVENAGDSGLELAHMLLSGPMGTMVRLPFFPLSTFFLLRLACCLVSCFPRSFAHAFTPTSYCWVEKVRRGWYVVCKRRALRVDGSSKAPHARACCI